MVASEAPELVVGDIFIPNVVPRDEDIAQNVTNTLMDVDLDLSTDE